MSARIWAAGAVGLSACAAGAGLSADGLGFVDGTVFIEVVGNNGINNNDNIKIVEPINIFYLYVETDQGFTELSGSILVGGGRSRFVVDGNANAPSTVEFGLILYVVQDTTYTIVTDSDEVVFEAVDGLLDPGSGQISEGTYRVSGNWPGFGFDPFEWALELDGEFAVVPAPGSLALLGAGVWALCRRRRGA